MPDPKMIQDRPCPRLVVAGLAGGSGKTTLALGLARAWVESGLAVAPFKKGPDYIDAAWLEQATGRRCHHLDAFLFADEVVRSSFAWRSAGSDVALVEGNRGLFDGFDAEGSYSTAQLARLLCAPAVLSINCTKMTGTAGAIAHGCRSYDPQLQLAAVVLNQVGTARQERVLRRAVERGAGIPVLGAIPRLRDLDMPERHLGLRPVQEHGAAQEVLGRLAERVAQHIDAVGLLGIARAAPPLTMPDRAHPLGPRATTSGSPRIGLLRDTSFHFYYPENLEALQRCGAKLVEIDALRAPALPPLQGLYIGGGFPETQAEALARNAALRSAVRQAALAGLPIYAECGGLIYLCRSLEYEGRSHPMADVFPVDLEIRPKPAGHGYARLRATEGNPFFAPGAELRGHEFHYARPKGALPPEVTTAFVVERGHGLGAGRDGLQLAHTLACFCHLHALATPGWAARFVDLAANWSD